MTKDDPTPDDGDESTDDSGSPDESADRTGTDVGSSTNDRAADDGDRRERRERVHHHDRNRSDDGWLSTLLSALERLEGSGSTSGRRRTDRTILDYDVSIRSGEDLLDESGFERRPLDERDEDSTGRRTGPGTGPGPGPGPASGSRSSRAGPTGGNRRRTRRHRSSSGTSSGTSDDHRVTTRWGEDELLVTADVAGVDPDDVTVGFDGSTLVVAVSDGVIDRIDVPWAERRAEATINNGVLTVLIEGDDAGEGGNGARETEDENE